MTYKIGKLKEERTTMVGYGEVIDPSIIVVSGSTLDTTKYDDITSIESWDKYSTMITTDYLQTRERIRVMLDDIAWTGCTINEKYIVIKYYLKESLKTSSDSDSEKIQFLMGEGLSLDESKIFLIKAYSVYHIKEIDACNKRSNSESLYEVIAKYLNLTDAADLIKITHKLFDLYKSQAIRGLNDGTAGEGLFDFLESTVGSSYETSGLEQQGYTLNTGDFTSFISELMDVLRNGNY